jgi:hypothetical protein
MDWNPFSWLQDYTTESLEGFFIHSILPFLLFLLAAGVLFFGMFRFGVRFIIAAIIVCIGLYLLGVFQI